MAVGALKFPVKTSDADVGNGGLAIASTKGMRAAIVLTSALIVSVAMSSAAVAEPITNTADASEQANAPAYGAMFDGIGTNFLLTAPPSYYYLPPHLKLKDLGNGSDGGGDGDAPFSNQFLASFSSWPSGSTGEGNDDPGSHPGENPFGYSLLNDDPFGDDPTGDDPLGDLLNDPFNGDPLGNDPLGGEGPAPEGFRSLVNDVRIAPEPATLLMLAPAAVLALRRRSRRP